MMVSHFASPAELTWPFSARCIPFQETIPGLSGSSRNRDMVEAEMLSQSLRGIVQEPRARAVQCSRVTRHLGRLCLVALSVAALISGCTSAGNHAVAGGPCSRRIAYTQGINGSSMAIIVRSECGAL